MKGFKEVEQNRRAYHADATVNSVHRSSLLAPNLAGASLDISFLNHSLLKRQYGQVACRITELDGEGRRIVSRLIQIDQPRVYTLPLSDDAEPSATDFMIEFFAAENLFIPFPAVMVNHRGPRFLNSVHSYNRVLNDVFEDNSINTARQTEAAIDVRLDSRARTFFVVQAGQTRCRGDIDVRLASGRRLLERQIAIDLPRFGHQEFDISALFPDQPALTGGVLTVCQPRQAQFFGRLLVGQREGASAFSANHSYYDSSGTAEYWEDSRPSVRLYPFFDKLENLIRVYPIQSPGTLSFEVECFASNGERLIRREIGELSSPGADILDVSINDLIAREPWLSRPISAFALHARPKSGCTPTRINHQLVFRDGGLESSINMSLTNPNVLTPHQKAGYCWGQLPLGFALDSWFGIASNLPDGAPYEVCLSLYDEIGPLGEQRYDLCAGAAQVLAPHSIVPPHVLERCQQRLGYVWYILRSSRPDVFAYTVTRHKETRQCSGEHGF